MIIEEFPFYDELMPDTQTEIIHGVQAFREFEKMFGHFFGECERGFANELIINMLARIYPYDRVIIPHRSHVKEMYFIRTGLVEVFNDSKDEMYAKKPILYLPKCCYFGDW